MKWEYDLLDLLLYGQFWIATAAWALLAQSYLLLTHRWPSWYLGGFLFCGTLGLYTLHRLVGLGRDGADMQPRRHAVIVRYRRHVLLYSGLGFALAGWCFLHLSPAVQLVCILPALLSLGYVLPLSGGRRLRDYAYVKIFLLVFSWSWLTVVAPAVDAGAAHTWPVWLMTAERACFIFAIAIPFDIRDMSTDRALGVATLPSRFGAATGKRLAAGALGLMLLFALGNYFLGIYSGAVVLALCVSALLTGAVIFRGSVHQSDYYFTGLVDGMMVGQFLLVSGGLGSW